jgi:phage baseplate assembly protein V
VRRSKLHNAVLGIAVKAQNLRSHPQIGTISGYDKNKQCVKVQLQPGGNETGWIPLGSVWVGNGWGAVFAPNLGTQVEVTFLDGNIESGSANLRFFSNVETGPAAPAGEMWLVHKNGQAFKVTNDGKLMITDGQGATITLDGAGNIVSQANQWTHTGPVHFTDNVQVDKTLTANTDVVGGGKSLKTHIHPDPQGGNVGPPV